MGAVAGDNASICTCYRDVDYGDILRELRKVITKDSNVACVAEAILCTGMMAKGLRSAFSANAKGFVEVRRC